MAGACLKVFVIDGETRADVERLAKLLSSCTLAPTLTVSVYSIDGAGVISYSGISSGVMRSPKIKSLSLGRQCRMEFSKCFGSAICRIKLRPHARLFFL